MPFPSRPPQIDPAGAAPARVVRPSALSDEEIAAWETLHRSRPELASPYFHPTFTRLVAEARAAHARDDVRVALLPSHESASGGTGTAFFPFQRGRWGRATPPGGRLCDFHGVVAPDSFRRNAIDVLRGSGLRSYAFHMLPPGQRTFAQATRTRGDASPGTGVRVNLEGGFDAFLRRREALGSKRHKKVFQFHRRMRRERSEVTFTWHDPDPQAWERLLAWKRAQYAATGFCDVLAAPWVSDLLARCRDARPADESTAKKSRERGAEGFRGVFCTLRAGGEVVAAHLALRSGPRLHAWFPAYDPSARSLSPGNVLMMELLRHAADRGVTAVDLGRDDEAYKADYATDHFPLLSGLAETPGRATQVAAAARRVRDLLKSHPAGAPARAAAAWVRPLRERLSLR
ncbi:GNAT family N-acetyltransferase [Alienimonas chondri]|uniref:BioF2-like acetyltransferase domain-containing protein n=1 Tax=Alienimonas chondri TaxID=2681879 RepID=A0ABX1VBX0_9PLAN|nr:GNAT family N-acetyltransferase [Alienimonas chondri]NNJ24556.1 hypothetical protein [Alienimonas chondri]